MTTTREVSFSHETAGLKFDVNATVLWPSLPQALWDQCDEPAIDDLIVVLAGTSQEVDAGDIFIKPCFQKKPIRLSEYLAERAIEEAANQ